MRQLALWIVVRSHRLITDRRGGVTLILALVMPVLMGVLALGLEVGSWSVTKVELQRRADQAAYAAIMRYNSGDTAQTATGIGVDMAALNGATAASPTWSAATNTTTASDVTVALVAGVRSASDNAMKAVVTASTPLSFGGLVAGLAFGDILGSRTAVTITATAYAEIQTTGGTVGTPGTGGQPCAVALNKNGTGVTVTGGSAVNLASCNVRSNAGVSVTNGSSITAPWVYGATITISGGSSITNGTNAVTSSPTPPDTTAPIDITSSQLADPYAGNTSISTDFSSLNPGSGTAFNGTWQSSTLNPGTYSSITSGSGAMTLNPGLYIVNGNISIGNGATVTGAGVTIVTSGTVSFGGGANVTLSAPISGTTSGGIPGVLIAGNSASTDTLSNGMKPTLTGVIYYPNGTMSISGGVSVGNGCLEVIAGSLSISNGSSFGSSCSSYGAATFQSTPGTPGTPGTSSYGLVQ
jgi:Flp pilus assembly protein TadG